MNLKLELKLSFAEDYMARFCGALSLSWKVESLATKMANKVEQSNLLAGRAPVTVAAAVIQLASEVGQENRSAAAIAERTGVSGAALSASYKLISDNKDLILLSL